MRERRPRPSLCPSSHPALTTNPLCHSATNRSSTHPRTNRRHRPRCLSHALLQTRVSRKESKQRIVFPGIQAEKAAASSRRLVACGLRTAHDGVVGAGARPLHTHAPRSPARHAGRRSACRHRVCAGLAPPTRKAGKRVTGRVCCILRNAGRAGQRARPRALTAATRTARAETTVDHAGMMMDMDAPHVSVKRGLFATPAPAPSPTTVAAAPAPLFASYILKGGALTGGRGPQRIA